MPNTCLGENQETNINIYISTTAEPDADGKKAAFVPFEKYDSKFHVSVAANAKKLTLRRTV